MTAKKNAIEAVVAAHDSTEASFGGHSGRGVGRLANRNPGFVAHFCLAVGVELGAEGERHALGVLGLKRVNRDRPMKGNRAAQTKAWREVPRERKASYRWGELARTTEDLLGDVSVIHVMDQEADNFSVLADLVEHGCRFVVRGSSRRNLERRSRPNIADALGEVCSSLFRESP